MSDYLFDGEGHDAELEALEAELGELKFSLGPPSLPSRVAVAFEPELTVPPSRRRHLPMFSAVVLAMVAGVTAFSAIKLKEAHVRAGWNLVPVLVAAVDLSEGTVLSHEALAERAVPEQFVTSSVIRPDSATWVINQKVLVPLQAGDPLLWSQFSTARTAERLSTKVVKRARAVSIDASGSAAVGGWVRPNDHVDLIGAFKDPLSGELVAVTLLEDVVVLATVRRWWCQTPCQLPEGGRDFSNVSLMVIPEEAELLVLAQELGKLTLSLRNEDDLSVKANRDRIGISTLLSGERTKALEVRHRMTIEIIRSSAPPKPP